MLESQTSFNKEQDRKQVEKLESQGELGDSVHFNKEGK
jgi:hypothetical protein